MASAIKIARKVENGRLAYYVAAADEGFWDKHWREQFNFASYAWADQGGLGWLTGPVKRWLPQDGLIVEAGCGLGHYVLALCKRGYKAEGVDFAPDTVRLVREARPDIPIRLGDATALDVLDDHYAGYISLGVVEHRYQGPEPFIREAYRVLRPGGIGIITVPWFHPLRRLRARLGRYDDSTQGMDFYQYAFTEQEFEQILTAVGFVILERSSYDPFKGLKDEVAAIARLRRHPTYGAAFERYLRSVLRIVPPLARNLGHMLLVVVRKPAGSA